jgi:GTP cyclohydrolase I
MEKMAPVSQMSAPMAYECSISGKLIQDQYQIVLGVIVPIATLCPCSKAISDYGAHNQRAEIRAQVIVDTQTEHSIVWFEDLITSLEKCSSCEVFPLVKREDVIREAILTLRDYPNVSGFSLEVEALESIHGHNAWATHQENF